MNARRIVAGAGALLLLSSGIVAAAGPASAAHVTCGQTIMVSTALDGNVGPCATGIVIGADNVTLDMNGFTISGNPGAGEGPGISVFERTGVTVRNGTVTQFDAGVAIERGSGNTVHNMQLVGNRSAGSDYGDGVALFRSNNNRITGNQVRNNGPYSGIGLIGSAFNVIDGNKITDNNQSANNTAGIRLENGPPSNDNIVTNNLVTTSGTFGIQVFAGGSRNVIRFNQAITSRLDGIVIFAGGRDNIVEQNSTRSNGQDGISVRSAAGSFGAPTGNRILRNYSFRNARFDLFEGTAGCATNVWSGNQAGTTNQPCTLNP